MVQNMDDNPWLLGKKVVLRKHLCCNNDCKDVGKKICAFPIIGDSGYQLQPWMMTPVRNPTNDGEVTYNQAHIKTCNVIERKSQSNGLKWRDEE